jgi:hypothetical protein
MHQQSSWLLAACVISGLVVPAKQSSAQSPAPKAGTRLITLGTAGGPVPRAKRAQSSNLLIVNGMPYLVDAGDGTARRLAKLKFNLRSLGTIFITHGHNDHTGGLPHLLSVQWGAQRSQPINVYGPPGTQGMIKAAIGYLNYDAEIRISDGSRTTPIEQVFFGHDVGTGQVYQDANITVTAVENTHFHFPAGSPGYGKYKSYSYRRLHSLGGRSKEALLRPGAHCRGLEGILMAASELRQSLLWPLLQGESDTITSAG